MCDRCKDEGGLRSSESVMHSHKACKAVPNWYRGAVSVGAAYDVLYGSDVDSLAWVPGLLVLVWLI